MRILRVTHFSWGATINNWYPDREAVERQLLTEVGRVKSKDIVHEEWYACEPIKVAKPEPLITLGEMLAWNKQGGKIE